MRTGIQCAGVVQAGAERVMRALAGENELAAVVEDLERGQRARAVTDAIHAALDTGLSADAVRESVEAGFRRYTLSQI